MSEQQLQSRQRVDTIDVNISPMTVRMHRMSAKSKNAYEELRKSRTASIGAVMIIVLFALCLLTPVLATHHPTKTELSRALGARQPGPLFWDRQVWAGHLFQGPLWRPAYRVDKRGRCDVRPGFWYSIWDFLRLFRRPV